MSKSQFRRGTTPIQNSASYPTADEFETSRRDFLTRFGATLLGAGTLAAALAGCGERAVNEKSEKKKNNPDMGADYGGPAGAAPAPDAQADKGKPKKDMELAGDPALPDASIDKKDQDPSPGYAPAPDAMVDQKDGMLAGAAPMPDAKVDKKDQGLSGGAPMPSAEKDKRPR